MIGIQKKLTRQERMALRLQRSYRCHLGRRLLRRYKKLEVFRRETRAGITLQCFFRVKLAEKEAMRKRHLAHYKRFMLSVKPNLKMGWSDADLESLAAIMMQAAWRRRQAYFARKRAENKRPFLTRMKAKLGVSSISDDHLLELAAIRIQGSYRQRMAYFERKRRAEVTAFGRQQAAATKVQALWRGGHTREKVKEEANRNKLKRLAAFLTNACFIKCFMTWDIFTQESKHNKAVCLVE